MGFKETVLALLPFTVDGVGLTRSTAVGLDICDMLRAGAGLATPPWWGVGEPLGEPEEVDCKGKIKMKHY